MHLAVGRSMKFLITGPVRSGKSARALRLALDFGQPVTYVATARVDPTDPEMIERVARHRADRGDMAFVELWAAGAVDLPDVIATSTPQTTLLVDSLGTWLAGHLLDLENAVDRSPVAGAALLEERTDPLIAQLRRATGNIVFVSEEAGWGVVPPSPLGRVFRDCLGRLAQRVAQLADRVELVVAGHALNLSSLAVPIDR